MKRPVNSDINRTTIACMHCDGEKNVTTIEDEIYCSICECFFDKKEWDWDEQFVIDSNRYTNIIENLLSISSMQFILKATPDISILEKARRELQWMGDFWIGNIIYDLSEEKIDVSLFDTNNEMIFLMGFALALYNQQLAGYQEPLTEKDLITTINKMI